MSLDQGDLFFFFAGGGGIFLNHIHGMAWHGMTYQCSYLLLGVAFSASLCSRFSCFLIKYYR